MTVSLQVPLQGAAHGAAVRVLCALLKLAWCRCRVPLSHGCLHLKNLGAATCHSVLCVLKLGCCMNAGAGCELGSVGAEP